MKMTDNILAVHALSQLCTTKTDISTFVLICDDVNEITELAYDFLKEYGVSAIEQTGSIPDSPISNHGYIINADNMNITESQLFTLQFSKAKVILLSTDYNSTLKQRVISFVFYTKPKDTELADSIFGDNNESRND